MANPFGKGWKYLMASFDQKIDENADPKVQIQQAVNAAKEQHQQITRQAANVIGNKKQLEMQMDRLQKSQEDHQNKARTAIQAADEAAAAGDTAKAAQFNNTAEVFSSQLVAIEQELENTKSMYQQAAEAADQAQRQQQESEARLKGQLAEVDKLLSQADQASMQQKTTEAMDTIGQFQTDDSVPTLDGIRDKIERRYADALGQQELLGNTVSDRMAEITTAGTDMKASAKLDEIRASMRGTGELTAGESADQDSDADLEEVDAVVDEADTADAADAADGK
ncbi:PspA/IM30 family protein [Corynebacterium breve]|uniref:PspA/IM30 family protein n=1 Tax=Corynebacterium breve TaxID=3049799 RepID=A0ABY8VEN9_9CORY|nr:PspA/IM30 family protein [Corynebacterium breve]WIM67577.1 PspA/IM30 family protein [Corynebacterium breve]